MYHDKNEICNLTKFEIYLKIHDGFCLFQDGMNSKNSDYEIFHSLPCTVGLFHFVGLSLTLSAIWQSFVSSQSLASHYLRGYHKLILELEKNY